jgi:hypothetical protein
VVSMTVPYGLVLDFLDRHNKFRLCKFVSLIPYNYTYTLIFHNYREDV